MFYFRNDNMLVVQTFKAQATFLLAQFDKQNIFFLRMFLRENIKTNKKLLAGIRENKN